jgi:hypothetical protein
MRFDVVGFDDDGEMSGWVRGNERYLALTVYE